MITSTLKYFFNLRVILFVRKKHFRDKIANASSGIHRLLFKTTETKSDKEVRHTDSPINRLCSQKGYIVKFDHVNSFSCLRSIACEILHLEPHATKARARLMADTWRGFTDIPPTKTLKIIHGKYTWFRFTDIPRVLTIIMKSLLSGF